MKYHTEHDGMNERSAEVPTLVGISQSILCSYLFFFCFHLLIHLSFSETFLMPAISGHLIYNTHSTVIMMRDFNIVNERIDSSDREIEREKERCIDCIYKRFVLHHISSSSSSLLSLIYMSIFPSRSYSD